MSTKRYNPEQIVTLLRQIEVEIANGKTTPPCETIADVTSRSCVSVSPGKAAPRQTRQKVPTKGRHPVLACGWPKVEMSWLNYSYSFFLTFNARDWNLV